MAPRITSELLFVGSMPADSTEHALECCAPLFADVVFALPDGETGDRQAWIGFEAGHMCAPHPDIEVAQPMLANNLRAGGAFRLRPGVRDIRFETMPRLDVAIESYTAFQKLREHGVIPESVRFQVSLPFPASIFGWFFRDFESMQAPIVDEAADFEREYPILERAYEEAWSRELPRLLDAIPADDLALQWDVCWEVLDLERLFSYTSADTAWERFAGPCRRMSREIPEDVLVGYHLCYGTFPEWPMREAQNLQLLVDMANTCIATSGRRTDWLHLAGPRHLRSHDDAFFRPLQRLHATDTRVFLGLIQPVDGGFGAALRARTASKYLADFGLAYYCGFGRQHDQTLEATLQAHRAALDAVVDSRASGNMPPNQDVASSP